MPYTTFGGFKGVNGNGFGPFGESDIVHTILTGSNRLDIVINSFAYINRTGRKFTGTFTEDGGFAERMITRSGFQIVIIGWFNFIAYCSLLLSYILYVFTPRWSGGNSTNTDEERY